MALAILLVCSVGKFAACGTAARLSGYGWEESAAVGTLMNARGLMELILLNIAFDRHLITQTTFTIYVLMACATTLAASPLFELVRPYLPEGAATPGLPTALPEAADGRLR